MDIGGVLGEAWGLYKKFLWQFFLTAFIVFVVLDLISALAAEAAGDSTGAGIFWALVAFVDRDRRLLLGAGRSRRARSRRA